MGKSRCCHSSFNPNKFHGVWFKDLCRTVGIPAHDQDPSIRQNGRGVSAPRLKEEWTRSKTVALRIKEFGRPQEAIVIVSANHEDTAVCEFSSGMVRPCDV